MNLRDFVNPPKHYRPAPFWLMNSRIEPSEIENRIREMKKKGFGGYFIAAAQGLHTGYLGDDWMKVIRRGVEIGREVEMQCWLHDEDRAPSGFAGGKLASPELHAAMLLTWVPDVSSLDHDEREDILCYTVADDEGTVSTVVEPADKKAVTGAFYLHRMEPGNARFNGGVYPDLMHPDAVGAFINATHERYNTSFKYDFGDYMPGIFTDCPRIVDGGFPETAGRTDRRSHPWTLGFADFFTDFHGYSPIEKLHLLLEDTDEAATFRHDYTRALSERFCDAFGMGLKMWCDEHNLASAGGFVHGTFAEQMRAGGTAMSLMEYIDIPACTSDVSSDDAVAIRETASVMHQLGRKKMIARVFGGATQDITFNDMKRIADFHLVHGATLISPQSISYSLKGDTKRTANPTLSYHQPYWEHLGVLNDYIGRTAWAVSQGKTGAPVLVLSPAWSAALGTDDTANGIESTYRELVESLAGAHVEFDIGDERLLSRYGHDGDGGIGIGTMHYTTVIVPPALSWFSTTIELLRSSGASLIFLGARAERVDGRTSDAVAALADSDQSVITADIDACIANVLDTVDRVVSVTAADGSPASDIRVMHTTEAAAHMVFLTSLDADEKQDVTVEVRALGGVVELDAATGRAFRYASEIHGNTTIIRTSIPAGGSRLFLVDQTQTSATGNTAEPQEESFVIDGPYAFRKLHDNTLVIDRCSLEVDGRKLLKNEPIWKARRLLWEKTGIEEFWGYQPWVLEERNMRTRTNTTVLTFMFEIRDLPEKLLLAMESADKFTVTVNDAEVKPTPGNWHIDKRFSTLNISEHLVEGTNVIRATTDFLWDTGIENIYLFGDFALGAKADGFPIIAEPETLATGDWCTQGYPFYGGSFIYKLVFDLDPVPEERFELDLGGIAATSTYVMVNGEEIGAIGFPPWRGDITGALNAGENSIEIEVIGSLRNVLGPHHHSQPESALPVGPETYEALDYWTDDYVFVPYGILDPPSLVRYTPIDAQSADGDAGDSPSGAS